MTDSHIDEAYDIEEGDGVFLLTHEGHTVEGICIRKRRQHPDDPEQVWEQQTWVIDAEDGENYEFGLLEGLARVEGAMDAYPKHFPLIRRLQEYQPEVADEDSLGYIVEVRHD